MSIQAKFLNFHDKIKLGREDDEYKSAREKDDSILKAVKKALKDEGYPVIEDFLQGSQSTATAVKHPADDFDIDRSVVIAFDDAPDDPVKVKKIVLKVLEDRGFKNAKIKTPCVTADYSSLSLHIDIPIYREQNGIYELAIGKNNSNDENKEWSNSDPKGLRDWINSKANYIGSASDKLKQFKRTVRYLKRWRDVKFSSAVVKKIFSIGLTVMAKEKFQPNFDDNGKTSDLKALRDTISAILNGWYFNSQGNEQYKVSVDLPTSPYRDIFDGSSVNTGTQLYNKLTSLKNKLDKVIAEGDVIKQCKLLNEIFGDDFEVPSSTSNASTAAKATYVTAGVAGTSQGA
ncbi:MULTISPECIES: nucleotidyltransferase domain-containing protein [unclassified Colwellia]|uniref:nucleotidyltransferase domain-containing protein n=1 Tax=unclassified Colwellia TaxID=196834 RepID=UPI0015F423C0|nr:MULTISPECIES: nucleotidyltransferase [unclassified Colwellia]MBA6256450.1 nucleotidyltransferase [Colwellia sp. MB3u-28]MBA6260347.1 nucleotidyltransferase [Colwellia sp. MB3u-41]